MWNRPLATIVRTRKVAPCTRISPILHSRNVFGPVTRIGGVWPGFDRDRIRNVGMVLFRFLTSGNPTVAPLRVPSREDLQFLKASEASTLAVSNTSALTVSRQTTPRSPVLGSSGLEASRPVFQRFISLTNDCLLHDSDGVNAFPVTPYDA